MTLAGCGMGTGGTPTTSDASSSAANGGGAPPIPQPELDGKKYLQDPCALLTRSQLTQLGVAGSGKKIDDGLGGFDCSFSPADEMKGVAYHAGVTTQNTIATLYGNRSNIPVFRPGTVAGYPSVTGNSTNSTVAGVCTTLVGIAKDMAVSVDAQPSDRNSADYKDPCPLAEKVAATVVNNIKGGK